MRRGSLDVSERLGGGGGLGRGLGEQARARMAAPPVGVAHHHAGGAVGPEYGRPSGHMPSGAVILRHPANLVEEEVGVRMEDRLAEVDARSPHENADGIFRGLAEHGVPHLLSPSHRHLFDHHVELRVDVGERISSSYLSKKKTGSYLSRSSPKSNSGNFT